MFEESGVLFLYTESPLHAGIGRGLGAVDLPIQRERSTGYPFIQAGGIKGRLRASARAVIAHEDYLTIFGPESAEEGGSDANEYAGAMAVGDARLAAMPVRSLAGTFAMVTSLDALARLARVAAQGGLPCDWSIPAEEPAGEEIWVGEASLNRSGQEVVLEDTCFNASLAQKDLIAKIADWLNSYALLDDKKHPEYGYFRKNLGKRLAILNEDAFRDFITYATEIQTHIHLDPAKKTVLTGQLWTAESLPGDTLLYTPIMFTRARKPNASLADAGKMRDKIEDFFQKKPRLNFGGDETTGQGIAAVRFSRAKGG